MQGGCAPTAAQKRWHQLLAECGCVVNGNPQVQLHHLEGSCFKHKKILVGQWFVIPLSWMLHDVHSEHPLNVTHHKKAFYAEYGNPAYLLHQAKARVLMHYPDAECPPDWVYALADDHYRIHENLTDWNQSFGGVTA